MFFIAGISPKIKSLGTAPACSCPVCACVSPLHIIHKYMTPHVFFIPTFPFHSEYIATCANCASIMSLQKDKGKAFAKDPGVPVYPEDLSALRDNFRRG